MLDLMENPKLDLASSNEISTQKISVSDHISGFQYTTDKLDSFVIDMDSFSHGGLNKEINQNPRITRLYCTHQSKRAGFTFKEQETSQQPIGIEQSEFRIK
ncbi:hypothetical protein J1N35_005767 [Gossypium stocksii]|uniref:Uncharacterized protein n=1 Tax=Gossypium stocksii TaxID=47602 RepID=A0A9D3WEI5_9ROSI|nr:hypothetical protein J1N35_005767 [Gossypium stocksii]